MPVPPPNNLVWSVRLLIPMWRRTTLSLTAAVIGGVLATFDPLFLRRLIDVELPQHHTHLALALVTAILGCLAGRSVLLLVSLYFNFTVQQDFAQSLRISMLEQLNRLSAAYHERTPAGDKLSRLERDVDQVSLLGSSILTSLLRAVVFFAANIVVMLRLNLAMTLALAPAILVFLWARARFSAIMKFRADLAQSEAGRATSVVNEYLAGVPAGSIAGRRADFDDQSLIGLEAASPRATKATHSRDSLFGDCQHCLCPFHGFCARIRSHGDAVVPAIYWRVNCFLHLCRPGLRTSRHRNGNVFPDPEGRRQH